MQLQLSFRQYKCDTFLDELPVPVHVRNSLNISHMCMAASPTICVAHEREHSNLISSRRRCHILCRHKSYQHVLLYPQGDPCIIFWTKTQCDILHRRMLPEKYEYRLYERSITNAHGNIIAHDLTMKWGTCWLEKTPNIKQLISADFDWLE